MGSLFLDKLIRIKLMVVNWGIVEKL